MPEHAVWLGSFTAERMEELLVRRDPAGDVCGGYLVGQLVSDLDQLAPTVTETIDTLRRELIGPLAERWRTWA